MAIPNKMEALRTRRGFLDPRRPSACSTYFATVEGRIGPEGSCKKTKTKTKTKLKTNFKADYQSEPWAWP